MKAKDIAIGSAIGAGITALGIAASKIIRSRMHGTERDIDRAEDFGELEAGPDDPGFNDYGSENDDFLSALTESEGEEGDNTTLSAYTYGYNDGYEDGYNTAVAEQIRSASIVAEEPTPEADDDLLPFETDSEYDHEVHIEPAVQEEEKEWPCIDALKKVAVYNLKEVQALILSYIPFSHTSDDAVIAAAKFILEAVFSYVKTKRKTAKNKHANSYSYAFSIIRSLQDGSMTTEMILSDAVNPGKVEKDLQAFNNASLEDREQALYDICLVLSVLDPEQVIEIVKPRKKENQNETPAPETAASEAAVPEGESHTIEQPEEVTKTAPAQDDTATEELQNDQNDDTQHRIAKSVAEKTLDETFATVVKEGVMGVIRATLYAMDLPGDNNDNICLTHILEKLTSLGSFTKVDEFISSSKNEKAIAEMNQLKTFSATPRNLFIKQTSRSIKRYLNLDQQKK